jgi:hypothetical protein
MEPAFKIFYIPLCVLDGGQLLRKVTDVVVFTPHENYTVGIYVFLKLRLKHFL